MALTEDQRLEYAAFVLAHDGWRIKYERYMKGKPMPDLGFIPSMDDFVQRYADDIETTFWVLEERRKRKQVNNK